MEMPGAKRVADDGGREIRHPRRRRDGEAAEADKWLSPSSQEKPLSDELRSPVPQTDTGGQVEQTKVSERTLVKELGKIEP